MAEDSLQLAPHINNVGVGVGPGSAVAGFEFHCPGDGICPLPVVGHIRYPQDKAGDVIAAAKFVQWSRDGNVREVERVQAGNRAVVEKADEHIALPVDAPQMYNLRGSKVTLEAKAVV